MSNFEVLGEVTDRIDGQLPSGIKGKLKFFLVPEKAADDFKVIFEMRGHLWALRLDENLEISDEDIARFCVML